MNVYHHLTRKQRYLIQDLLEIGKSQRQIAKEVGCHPSTICRELKRNSNAKACYNAKGAHRFAHERKLSVLNPNIKRKIDEIYGEMIRELLRSGWSPEQISGRLKLEGRLSISHETIYKYILIEKQRGRDLHRYLRCFGRRRKRLARRKYLWKEPRKFIDQRSEDANARLVFGHWERDLLNGKRVGKALLTVVERKSRFLKLKIVYSKSADEVNAKTAALFSPKSRLPVLSITNDNGVEFGKFSDLEDKIKVPIYYTTPYSPWERGTNENLNGLLRQIFRKGEDIFINESNIKQVEDAFNLRPRKELNYRNPFEVLFDKKMKLINNRKEYLKIYEERSLKEYNEYLEQFDN